MKNSQQWNQWRCLYYKLEQFENIINAHQGGGHYLRFKFQLFSLKIMIIFQVFSYEKYKFFQVAMWRIIMYVCVYMYVCMYCVKFICIILTSMCPHDGTWNFHNMKSEVWWIDEQTNVMNVFISCVSNHNEWMNRLMYECIYISYFWFVLLFSLFVVTYLINIILKQLIHLK